jgi:hypothetical protein
MPAKALAIDSGAIFLGEVSRHGDAVYDAMRRADRIDHQISIERDHG